MPSGGNEGPDLNSVSARKNLSETAFFFPHLVSNGAGEVRIEFQVPEALTKWKLMAFAHDKNLRSGSINGEVVTAKDLMAQPNPPRFLREGDILEFTAKVSNQGATRQKGAVKLALMDTRTLKPLDVELANTVPTQEFDLPASESKTFSWRLSVPDGVGPLTYKVVAASERNSDGEEGIIPVLSRRVLVQESLPLPIRNAGTKNFDFTKLRLSGESNTIKHQSYTVQMVSQPAWYAVMALPYLMEFPHECTEQTFSRLYANSLARHIGNSDPKIRRIFDLWKGTDTLDSPLEKNQDLKSVMLEETPWVRQAVKEGQARKNVGILFDENRLNNETAALMEKMASMQYADGSWPWFPGGPGNDYITLYITTGYGRLQHLGVKVDAAPAIKAIDRLDDWADRMYQIALKHNPEKNHLSPTIALYLYARSFFLADKGVANQHKAAIDYWLGQAKQYWPQLANRQSQAHLAVGLKRFNDKETPVAIMKSIKERSKNEEEMGMYWRDLELNYSWFHAPIETQAMMIEAFDEVMNDAAAVEDCKVWLLKMKQTTDWKTTKATADAIYALLLRGDNLLKSDALVEVTVGNQPIKPEKVEAGTGFYEHKFLRTEVQPSMATITVKKTDQGVSWGSVHWSYLEDISKVTPHEGTPLKLQKKLFKRTYTKTGPVITEVKPSDSISVGDEIVVRIVLRTDRDMEYVHMKDHRGSGTEPVNVLSRYKYQDGLGYYESTKDTASHFYIDYLPKGTYVFEYPVRVQHKGKYPTGYANIQCMYAPEFNSHSENINLEVK
ncbi:MAG: alpha-2-macroglobulin family protein [Gemmataceae bacterium]